MAIGKLKNKRFNVRYSRRRFGYGGHQQSNGLLFNNGEKRFMELMNASFQGIIVHSYDWKPLFVNKAYADTLGYLPQDILDWQSIHLLYPYDETLRLKGYLNSRVNTFSKQLAPSVYEVQVKHREGRPVILQHTVSLTSWEGHPAALISAIDVTEKYLSRQALALSEERFRDFAESASDWCWECDEHFRFTFMSDSFERIAGVSKSAIIGKTRREFFENNLPKDYSLDTSEQMQWDQHIDDLKKHLPFSHFEYNWFGRDGELLVLSASGKPVFDDLGQFRGYRGTARNITDEKMLSEKLSFQASHDELTGLLNRRYFDEELKNAIQDAQDNKNEHVLVYMDLDRFKIVNDTCGHSAGDELLQQLSYFFSCIFSKRDVLARLGGDEFAVIMRNCTVNQSMRTTQQLHRKIDDFRFIWNDKSFTIGVSAGVVMIDQSSDNASRLLQNVDAACYMAKELGRNKTHIFSENDDDLSRRQSEMQWAARISDVLPNDEFTLFVQPIVPLNGAQGVFYELLLRMNDGENFILPTVFLSAAERYDLSMNIDYWVLKKALFWLEANPKLLSDAQLIFINLSGKTVGKRSFLEKVISLIQQYNVPPEKLCFEITETTAIANLAEAAKFVAELKAIGCYFALDDFGSGVSSFAYLKNLPVDYLKIDGSFIGDIDKDEVSLAMVKSINEISHIMDKKTIAEMVESDSTFALLRNMGVDYAQGHGICKPFPLSQLKLEEVRQYLNSF